jgi:hypothetical protein
MTFHGQLAGKAFQPFNRRLFAPQRTIVTQRHNVSFRPQRRLRPQKFCETEIGCGNEPVILKITAGQDLDEARLLWGKV